MHSCPLNATYVDYLEYVLSVVFALNVLYHFTRYFVLKAKVDIDSAIIKKCAEIKQTSAGNLSLKSFSITSSLFL